MVMILLGSLTGRQVPIETVSVSDASSFSDKSLGYFAATGIFTASTNNTEVHAIVIGRNETTNVLTIHRLSEGDIVEGDYTNGITNLKLGNGVDLDSSVIFDAADERTSNTSASRFAVKEIDVPSTGKLRCTWHTA